MKISGGCDYGFGRFSRIVIVELPLIEGSALDAAVTVIVVAVSSAAICRSPAAVMIVPVAFAPERDHVTERSKNPDPLTTACRLTLPPLTVFAVSGITVTDEILADELVKATAGANGDILKIFQQCRNAFV